MAETFIGEAIAPVAGSFELAGTTRGEPALPGKFRWRDKEYEVREVLSRRKGYGPCPSGEIYLRKHYYKVRTDDGSVMRIYFERHPRSPRERDRWWLYTLQKPG